jgi:hypothetical protein
MNPKIPRWTLLTALLLVVRAQAEPGNGRLHSEFTFYGDNTEFFEPFRLRQTLLGQQFRSYLDLETGERTRVWAGLFADHPSALLNSSVNVLPILSFVYHQDDSQGTFGTLQPVDRHGLMEPMEVTTLEITRPLEYGIQWVQSGAALKTDLFLDWQVLLTPSSREIFDYGGSVRLSCFPFLEFDGQSHCYHVGGVTYPGAVRNNYTGGLGLTLKSSLPLLGDSSLAFLGFGSKDIDRTAYPGPVNGGGLFWKGTLSPVKDLQLFGIVWIGKDFMSEEGDSNYNSFGYDGVHYLSDRHYEETGIQWKPTLENGITFDLELRSHWVEDSWAHSFRVLAQVPFDVEVDLRKKKPAGSEDE